MILIDGEKSIMAGEARVIITEMAATVDRFALELSKSQSAITYDEIMEKFIDAVHKVKKLREKTNASPHEIDMDIIMNELFGGADSNLNMSKPLTESEAKRILNEMASKKNKEKSEEAEEAQEGKKKKKKKKKKNKKKNKGEDNE
jgi:hypothetical protein